jgi:hypothetical protein
MWEDTSGLLWTVTTMPSPDWKARGDKSRRFERYNTMIEVIDPSKGTLLASHQVDAMVLANTQMRPGANT